MVQNIWPIIMCPIDLCTYHLVWWMSEISKGSRKLANVAGNWLVADCYFELCCSVVYVAFVSNLVHCTVLMFLLARCQCYHIITVGRFGEWVWCSRNQIFQSWRGSWSTAVSIVCLYNTAYMIVYVRACVRTCVYVSVHLVLGHPKVKKHMYTTYVSHRLHGISLY